MFSAIYIEEEVARSDRVLQLLERFSDVPQIPCERYGQIFNRSGQNFRLQKKAPALILAKKYGNLVLPVPDGYGFNQDRSYYFSHMMNCVYDCRYCFLQGMYRSANYVLFTNYEDFGAAITATVAESENRTVFYSGYDCDSLALEPVSNFCEYFLPLLGKLPTATLEIRSKSTQIRKLLDTEPLANCVVAMSFTDQLSTDSWEHKVPSIAKRLESLKKLQQAGWPIALRFEPLVFDESYLERYQVLFKEVFTSLDGDLIHSVSTGMFRMPIDFHKKIVKLYPDEPLLARDTVQTDGMTSLMCDTEEECLQALEKSLFEFISSKQYYRCA
jgi:spore photoproduct lyase